MREIKFRAWIHKELKIKRVDEIGLHEGWVEVQGGLQPYLIDELDLMQYTELKDKNGVEIYEGDIALCYPEFSELCYTKVVEWDAKSPSLGITTNGRSGATLCDNNQDILLVIGNIHENPELLK